MKDAEKPIGLSDATVCSTASGTTPGDDEPSRSTDEIKAETCEHCRWWCALNTEDRYDSEEGQCRRLPPTGKEFPERQGDPKVTLYAWPCTYHDEWCGEFRPVADKPKRSDVQANSNTTQ